MSYPQGNSGTKAQRRKKPKSVADPIPPQPHKIKLESMQKTIRKRERHRRKGCWGRKKMLLKGVTCTAFGVTKREKESGNPQCRRKAGKQKKGVTLQPPPNFAWRGFV